MTAAATARIFSSSAAFAEAGLPRRAMRMTVVIDELGEGHAVLMVRTNRGDFVLDNKTSSIPPWHRTGYVYIKRESQDIDRLGVARRHRIVADHDREPVNRRRGAIQGMRRISRSALIFGQSASSSPRS